MPKRCLTHCLPHCRAGAEGEIGAVSFSMGLCRIYGPPCWKNIFCWSTCMFQPCKSVSLNTELGDLNISSERSPSSEIYTHPYPSISSLHSSWSLSMITDNLFPHFSHLTGPSPPNAWKKLHRSVKFPQQEWKQTRPVRMGLLWAVWRQVIGCFWSYYRF